MELEAINTDLCFSCTVSVIHLPSALQNKYCTLGLSEEDLEDQREKRKFEVYSCKQAAINPPLFAEQNICWTELNYRQKIQ